ncbi:MAG TPA: peptidoglycan DD-metalloendopeptidase family protein [Rhodanobacteraceae bacterium]|jgi:lipoprotein NlpD|nr:peptidoglycan DD-metalloendopeptidase family protein [Rhodanobacteraceae bacterium]
MMRTTSSCKVVLAAIVAAMLLAGCVTTPAPVVNHSFGPSDASAPAPATATQPAASSGAQTFGIGGHANGTTTAAGYTVAPGDTLYSIAFAHGLDFRALAADNGIPPPYTIHPGQVLKLSAPATVPVAAGNPVAGTTAATQPSGPVFGPVTTRPTPAGNASVAAAPAPVSAPTTPNEPPPAPAATVAEATPVEAPAVQPVVAATPTPPPGATRNAAGITWRWPASGNLISGFQAGSGGDGAGVDIAGKAGDPVRAAASGTVVYSGNGLIGYGELVIIKHNDTYLSAYGHNSRRLVKEGQHVDAGQEIALMGASGAPRVELHFEIRKNGKPVDPMDYLPKRN